MSWLIKWLGFCVHCWKERGLIIRMRFAFLNVVGRKEIEYLVCPYCNRYIWRE